MSRHNVELVRRIYEHWARKEWSLIPEFFDPDAEVDLSRNVFNPGTYSGYAGIHRLLQGVDEMWDDFRILPTELVDAGDKVLATVRIGGTGKESGVEVEMQVMNVWTIRDAKVVRIVGGYRDRAEALAAAGL